MAMLQLQIRLDLVSSYNLFCEQFYGLFSMTTATIQDHFRIRNHF